MILILSICLVLAGVAIIALLWLSTRLHRSFVNANADRVELEERCRVYARTAVESDNERRQLACENARLREQVADNAREIHAAAFRLAIHYGEVSLAGKLQRELDSLRTRGAGDLDLFKHLAEQLHHVTFDEDAKALLYEIAALPVTTEREYHPH